MNSEPTSLNNHSLQILIESTVAINCILQGTPQEVAFNNVKGMGENLKNLNRQLYFIRKSKKSEISSVMGKRFK